MGLWGNCMTPTERLKSLIGQQRGLQKELSIAISVSSSTINNWLSRNTEIPASKVIPICEFLGITPMFLLTGNTEEMPASTCKLSTEQQFVLDYYDALPYKEKKELIRELVLREAASSGAGQGPPDLLVSSQEAAAPGINKPKAPPGQPPKPKKQAQ